MKTELFYRQRQHVTQRERIDDALAREAKRRFFLAHKPAEFGIEKGTKAYYKWQHERRAALYPEKDKAERTAWDEKNRHRRRNYAKNWRLRNPGAAAESQREWRERFPKEFREHQLAYIKRPDQRDRRKVAKAERYQRLHPQVRAVANRAHARRAESNRARGLTSKGTPRKNLTPRQRSANARRASRARWSRA